MIKQITLILAAWVVVLTLTPAWAAEKERKGNSSYNSVSATLAAGGYLFDGGQHLRAAPAFGIKLGWDMVGSSIVDSLGIEASYDYVSTSSTRDASEIQGHLFRVDALFPFTPRARTIPFVAVGVGGMALQGPTRTDVNPLLNYGAGVKYLIEDYLAVRGDLRHLLPYNHAHTRNNFELTVGLSYFFGKERKQKPVPPAAPKPKNKETKPATPPDSANKSAQEAARPADASDASSTTLEQPAQPPADVPVPAPVQPKVTREAVLEFQPGSAALKDDEYQDLIDVAETLKAYPYASVSITGPANAKLASQRTEVLKQKLLLMGIAPDRIVVSPGNDKVSDKAGANAVTMKLNFNGREPNP